MNHLIRVFMDLSDDFDMEDETGMDGIRNV